MGKESKSPMDEENQNNLVVTPEEQKAEQEAMAEVKEDELKQQLAEDMGIDPDIEDELLDKIVSREKASRERLSSAIKQKINWRERAESKLAKQKLVDGGETPKEGDAKKEEVTDVDERFRTLMEERDLKELNLSEEVESKVKILAQLEGISVREAVKDPYIVSMQEGFDKEERIKKSIPKRSNKGSYASGIDASKPLDPANFDFNSEEGIKAWNEAKVLRHEYERENKV